MKFHLKCSLDWLRGIINKHLEFLHHRKATISTANWKLDSGAPLNAQAAGLARFAASPLIHWQDGGQAVCSQGRLLKEGIQWKWADGHSSGTVTDTTHRRHPCPLGRHPKCTPVTGEELVLRWRTTTGARGRNTAGASKTSTPLTFHAVLSGAKWFIHDPSWV